MKRRWQLVNNEGSFFDEWSLYNETTGEILDLWKPQADTVRERRILKEFFEEIKAVRHITKQEVAVVLEYAIKHVS